MVAYYWTREKVRHDENIAGPKRREMMNQIGATKWQGALQITTTIDMLGLIKRIK